MAKRKDPLGRVMSKVAKGQKLTKHDREILSAAADAMNKRDVRGRSEPLEKVMRKVAEGKRLTKKDREILSAAQDAIRGKRKVRRTKRKKKSRRTKKCRKS